MPNIVPIHNPRGFTRMDNQMMDGLMAIDLSAREMKIVLYVAKATLNFSTGAHRIPAVDIAKATHIHPDTVSKAISGLLRRRVLYREGGARGDIGGINTKAVFRPNRHRLLYLQLVLLNQLRRLSRPLPARHRRSRNRLLPQLQRREGRVVVAAQRRVDRVLRIMAKMPTVWPAAQHSVQGLRL